MDLDKILLDTVGEKKAKEFGLKKKCPIRAISESVDNRIITKINEKRNRYKKGINAILDYKLGYGESLFNELNPTFTQISNKNYIFKPKIKMFGKENIVTIEVNTGGNKVPSDMKSEIVDVLNLLKKEVPNIHKKTKEEISNFGKRTGIRLNSISENGYPTLEYVKINGIKPDFNFADIKIRIYDEESLELKVIKKENMLVIE